MGSLCLQPFFLRILYIVGKILNILRFAVPIILIIRIGIDVYKSIIDPENKEGLSKTKNRILASIIVFLTPTIITLLYEFIEKNIVNNEYSDLTVCREFANMEYINALENEIEEINKTKSELASNQYKSDYERDISAVRLYVNNKTNDSNSDSDTGTNSNNDSNIDDNIQSVVTNNKGSLQAKKYNNWNYYLYVPDSAKTSRKPLVVFLHGSGERGTDISKLENYGFAKYIKKEKKDYDTYILMPQLPSGSWDTSKLMTLINKIVSENNVDRSRISISGFSLGTVPLPSLIEENPRYFSAVVFIASCTDGVDKVSYFRNTPTRLYHGGSDSSCRPSHSQEFADALKKNNGNVNLFILPNRPHNIVNDVFKDGKVISWMTAQRR